MPGDGERDPRRPDVVDPMPSTSATTSDPHRVANRPGPHRAGRTPMNAAADLASLSQALITSRHSVSPKRLAAPGPDARQLQALVEAAPRLADPAQLACIRSDLPILIASGDADPLAAGGVLLEQLGQRYRDAGVADVAVKLYPAARHEILNETNRDEVTGDVVGWLRGRSGLA